MSEVSHLAGTSGSADPSPFTLWFLATLPIDNAIVLALVDRVGLGQLSGQVVTFVMTLVVFRMDLASFRKARPGRGRHLGWWFWFMPVYLWKRCRRGGGSMAPFWAQMGILAVAFLVAAMAATFLVGRQSQSLALAYKARSRAALAAPSFPEAYDGQKAVVDEVLREFPRDARARLAKARSLHDNGDDGAAEAILRQLLLDRRAVARFPREGYDAVALLAFLMVSDGEAAGGEAVARAACLSSDPDASGARRSLAEAGLCGAGSLVEAPPASAPFAPPGSAVPTHGVPVAPARSSGSAGRASMGVGEALESVGSQGLPVRSVRGWTIYADARRRVSWIFPKRSDPAWPALAIRRDVASGVVPLPLKIVCESGVGPCAAFAARADALVAEAFADVGGRAGTP